MSNDKQFEGLDFNPSTKSPKKTISITISNEAGELLEFLQRRYGANVSRYIDKLLLMVKSSQQGIEPINYTFEGGKYRETTLLLRKEVADFLDSWKNYGKCGNVSINSTTVQPSTPLQIAKKLSWVIANDSEVMGCDSNIYGYNEGMQESKFKRAEEKSKELPE